jgi:hypothetical protein
MAEMKLMAEDLIDSCSPVTASVAFVCMHEYIVHRWAKQVSVASDKLDQKNSFVGQNAIQIKQRCNGLDFRDE